MRGVKIKEKGIKIKKKRKKIHSKERLQEKKVSDSWRSTKQESCTQSGEGRVSEQVDAAVVQEVG